MTVPRKLDRSDLRQFLRGGADDLVVRYASDVSMARAALYFAIGEVLGGRFPSAGLERLPALLDLTLDKVDRFVLRFALGDRMIAAERLARLAAVKPRDRRVVLWSAYARGNVRFRNGVPRAHAPQVFQYWDHSPPPDVAQTMAAWRNSVGQADHRVFDSEAARALIDAAIGAEGTRAYDAAWHATIKSDLFRLVRLHEVGGLYVDADMRSVAATADTLLRIDPGLHLTIQAHFDRCGTQTNVIAAAPRHPLIGDMLRHCLAAIRPGERGHPLSVGGPAALSRAAHRYFMANPDADLTCLSLSETSTLLAANFRPSYKDDDRSWQRAFAADQP